MTVHLVILLALEMWLIIGFPVFSKYTLARGSSMAANHYSSDPSECCDEQSFGSDCLWRQRKDPTCTFASEHSVVIICMYGVKCHQYVDIWRFVSVFKIVEMSTRVYIGRLSKDVRDRDVERFFKGYGRVRDVMLKNGYGFVVGVFCSELHLDYWCGLWVLWWVIFRVWWIFFDEI